MEWHVESWSDGILKWNGLREKNCGSYDLTCYYGNHKKQRGMKATCSVAQLKHFISKFPSIIPYFTLQEYCLTVGEIEGQITSQNSVRDFCDFRIT